MSRQERLSRLAPATALFVVVAGCAPHAGRILVVVTTDIAVPDPLGEIDVRVARTDVSRSVGQTFSLRSADDVPLSFAVAPRDAPSDVDITVDAYRRGASICLAPGEPPDCTPPLVSRRAITGFVPGSTRVLEIFLGAACGGVVCAPSETCTAGVCGRVLRVDPADLPQIEAPGGELALDAGPEAADAGTCFSRASCAVPTVALGTIAADTGASILTYERSTSAFLLARLAETDFGIADMDLSFRASLVSPPGTDFDLYAYSGVEGGAPPQACTEPIAFSTSAGVPDAIAFGWDDDAGLADENDSRWIVFEVRHAAGSCSAASWTLRIEGNR